MSVSTTKTTRTFIRVTIKNFIFCTKLNQYSPGTKRNNSEDENSSVGNYSYSCISFAIPRKWTRERERERGHGASKRGRRQRDWRFFFSSFRFWVVVVDCVCVCKQIIINIINCEVEGKKIKSLNSPKGLKFFFFSFCGLQQK